MVSLTLKHLVQTDPEGVALKPENVLAVGGYRSVGEMFEAAIERFDDRVAMRHRDRTAQQWLDLSWLDLRKAVHEVAAGLIDVGVQHGDRVAILSASRLEWALTDLACLVSGAVTVPIYPSNLSHEVHYVLEHSGARVVVCEDREQLGKVLEVWDRLPELELAVLLDGKVKADDERLCTFVRLRERGRARLAEHPACVAGRRDQVRPPDAATIVYTSGTTGPPKGALLTHTNVLFELHAMRGVLEVDTSDETLLFLPLAHIFGRVGFLAMLQFGYIVSFAESIDRAIDNMQEVRPTFVFSVPRIYEKVYEKVMAGVRGGGRIKRQLFAFSMAVGRAVSQRRQAQKGIPPHLYFSFQAAKLLVFNTLKNTFGGELRFFISGGAPLAREIAEFLHAADILVLEGYGLTEDVAAANVNRLGSFAFGTVGPPLDGVEQKIATDGEILIRGHNVFKEYYKNPEATAEAIDPEGWFHTGDIGEFDAAGRLRITDRKKDLIVTAGGKNVAPQNLENLLKTQAIVSQAMIVGDKRKYLVAILTLNPDELLRIAERHAIAFDDLGDLVEHPEVQRQVDKAVARVNRDLASYETIKRFACVWPDFEVGEELTPSLKIKRKVTGQKYRDKIEALYADAGATGGDIRSEAAPS